MSVCPSAPYPEPQGWPNHTKAGVRGLLPHTALQGGGGTPQAATSYVSRVVGVPTSSPTASLGSPLPSRH